MRLEFIDDVVGDCSPQTNQQDARQQVNNQGLLNRCWSPHTASIVGRPKMPDILVGTVQKNSCVGGDLKNERGVMMLRYPVEHSVVTNWDDATKESIA